MAWTCPLCGFDNNDDSSIRCSCGQELTIKEKIDYKKIGGGLYLVVIGLLITPISYLIPFLKRFESGQVQFEIETIQIIIFVLLPIVLLFLLIRKNRLFPKIIIAYYIAGSIIAWVNYILDKHMNNGFDYYENLNKSIDVAVITTIVSLAWILYFTKSKRSKMTFVN